MNEAVLHPSPQQLWYYADAANQPVGPLPMDALQHLAKAGVILPETHVIEKGGTAWKKFASIVPPPAHPEKNPVPADTGIPSEPFAGTENAADKLQSAVKKAEECSQTREQAFEDFGNFFCEVLPSKHTESNPSPAAESSHVPAKENPPQEAPQESRLSGLFDAAKDNPQVETPETKELTLRNGCLGCLGCIGIFFIIFFVGMYCQKCSREKEDASPLHGTPRQKIDYLMKKHFGDRLRSVEMLGEGTSQDPAIIVVEFNGGIGSDNAHLKQRIERDMAEAYRLVFQSGVSISQHVVMTAWGKTVDMFGKMGEKVIYRTVLNTQQAARVSWDNLVSVNWPLVWEINFICPEFSLR